MDIRDDLRSIFRSWRQHFGLQSATLVVLTATFSVIVFLFGLALNFQRVLTVLGEQVQVSAYLAEGLDQRNIEDLRKTIESRTDVTSVEFISKDKAAFLFRDQMASYAPDLMSDSEFATPFPASFQIRLRELPGDQNQLSNLEALATDIKKMTGVEDVSYGQSWVRNYASFVGVLQAAGFVMAFVLLTGSIFVVANSIRTLISGRRDEIEIFELIGATSNNIRRPYLVEGVLLCILASVLALSMNAVFYSWQISVMKKSLAFARMAQVFSFLSFAQAFAVVIFASGLGIAASWMTVKNLNSGWAAARGVRN